ncbi:hypothetical protein IJU97_05150 [bacterium]|nr:hypothetical protein [bacterium]
MSELTATLNQSVENAAKKLLLHFKEQYGALIFIPLGVNENTTPAKIVPSVVPAFEQEMMFITEGQINVLMKDDAVGKVFDSFMNAFFDSLNFIAKGIMNSLDLKMMWNEFKVSLANRKQNNPEGYTKRKTNLTLVIQGVFDEIVNDLKAQGKNVVITNGTENFGSIAEAIEKLEIFA